MKKYLLIFLSVICSGAVKSESDSTKVIGERLFIGISIAPGFSQMIHLNQLEGLTSLKYLSPNYSVNLGGFISDRMGLETGFSTNYVGYNFKTSVEYNGDLITSQVSGFNKYYTVPIKLHIRLKNLTFLNLAVNNSIIQKTIPLYYATNQSNVQTSSNPETTYYKDYMTVLERYSIGASIGFTKFVKLNSMLLFTYGTNLSLYNIKSPFIPSNYYRSFSYSVCVNLSVRLTK